jgi:hypothetical protein
MLHLHGHAISVESRQLFHYNEKEEDTILCKECSENLDLDYCYLFPITNSLHTGICAFIGGWYDEEEE